MRLLALVSGSRLAFTLSLVLVLALGGCASSSQRPGAVQPLQSCECVLENFDEVTHGVLWRGAQPDQAGAACLIQQGVKTIVNLELLHDDLGVFRQVNLASADPYKVGYFRVRDWEPNAVIARTLLDSHVAHFLAILRQQPKPLYVHCRSGQNRTGVMVAAFRVIEEGVCIEKAIRDMKQYQGFWASADAGYIRSLSPERIEKIRRMIQEWIPKVQAESQIVCTGGECDIEKR